MRLVEELADNLAKDAIELANHLGNDDVICEAAKVLLKGLATGVSVCFATAVSFILFQTPITSKFLAGGSSACPYQ